MEFCRPLVAKRGELDHHEDLALSYMPLVEPNGYLKKITHSTYCKNFPNYSKLASLASKK